MKCPNCGKASMEVMSSTKLPAWRLVLGLCVLLAGIVCYIWSDVINPSDGIGAGTATAAEVALASKLHTVSLLCIPACGALLWQGQRTRLQCPACGYRCTVSSRALEGVDRDERYENLREGATPAERFGMFLERHGSQFSDVGATTNEQGRQTRSWYGKFGVFAIVLFAAIALVVVGMVVYFGASYALR